MQMGEVLRSPLAANGTTEVREGYVLRLRAEAHQWSIVAPGACGVHRGKPRPRVHPRAWHLCAGALSWMRKVASTAFGSDLAMSNARGALRMPCAAPRHSAFSTTTRVVR